ncbi:MAG: hypothetical protein ACKVU0_09375 [Saprospiraceae bacterium]
MKLQAQILALLLFLVAACVKEHLPTIEELGYWGTTTATKNDIPWVGAPVSFININHGKGFQIKIDSLDKYGIRRESLSFSKVPFQPGKNYLVNTFPQIDDGLVGAHYFILDDDVILGNYLLLESDSTSFITLTSFDSTSRELRGTFDVTLIVDHRPDPSYPDTIRFRNGQFHTKLKD